MLGTTVQALAVGGLPLARLLRPEPARLTATALLYFVSSCCSATGVTLCIVATNACAARHPARRGAINGVATTLESVAKSVGPIGGASLFACALENEHAPAALGGAGVFFFGFAAVLGATYGAVGLALPRALFGPAPAPEASHTRAGSSARASCGAVRPGASEDPAHAAPSAPTDRLNPAVEVELASAQEGGGGTARTSPV